MYQLFIIDDRECREDLDVFIREHRDSILFIMQEEHFNQRMEDILSNLNQVYKMHRKVVLHNDAGAVRVSVSDIICVEASSDHSMIHHDGGASIKYYESINFLEDELKGLRFFRLNNDYLVNLDHMDRYLPGNPGYVLLKNGTRIGVNEEKARAFIDYLVNWK